MIVRNYNDIDWNSAELQLLQKQYEILKAFRSDEKKLVLKLQHELTRSFSARALAVRKVTNSKGKNTPGPDGKILRDGKQKLAMVHKLKNLNNYIA